MDWVRSSHSGQNGNCVEVGALRGTTLRWRQPTQNHKAAPVNRVGSRAVRDSKNPTGAVLVVPAFAFTVFMNATKTGAFR